MADNDIIDFYKKADNDDTSSEPLKEQVETPEPAVSETIAIPVPESNDPFDKFLYNLADKIKDSKPVISVVAETEQQPEPQDEPFNKFLLELADKLQGEKVITKQQQLTLKEQVKQPTPANPDDDDPFKSFIGSFANILKQDELINREENIKEATINFINKLKEQPEEPFIIEDEIEVKPKTKSKVKNKKYLPPVLTKKTQKQVLPVQEKEPVVQEQSDTLVTTKSQPDDNSYVKELKQADKNKLQIKKDKTSTDIKSVVEKQVAEILSRYPNLGFTGGGGGTNAVQYAEGGTMNGNLTVNGTVNATTYLSGGVNLYNLLSSTGGGENSQTLVYSTLTEELSITNGNSVSLSSLSDKSYANSNFLKLSGGTISGNLTVQGNISALGTATFANTIFTTTSALSVYNTGPGPALYVYQSSGPYDVASFYDGDGIEVLHVGNAGPGGFGKVGVNESFPNEELTVRGSISATETIYANRIGIGTSSPGSTLTVVGNVSSTGTAFVTGLNLLATGSIQRSDNGGLTYPDIGSKTFPGNGNNGRFGVGYFRSIDTQYDAYINGQIVFLGGVRLEGPTTGILNLGGNSQVSGPHTFNIFRQYINSTNFQKGTFTYAGSGFVIGTQYTTTAGNSALSSQAMPIILAPGYNQSLSATAPIVLQQTWNNANNPFTLLSANVIDNASNSSSRLLDLQTNGTSVASINKVGSIAGRDLQIVAAHGSGIATNIYGHSFSPNANSAIQSPGIYWPSTFLLYSSYGLYLNDGAAIGWATGNLQAPVANLELRRDANNTLALRNGLSAQTFRIYNTYTAGTPVSSEFGYTRWSGNTFQIGTSATGSGSNNRVIQFNVGAYNPLTLNEDQVSLAGGSQLWFFGRAIIRSESDGNLRLTNWGANGFNLLRFGGSTAAFPALKNSLSGIQIRRADDLGFAPLTASNITATNYLSAGVNLLDIFSGGGGGVTHTYRFNYIPDTSYSGKATSGSLETDNVWTINRTIFTNTGTVSATGKATNVAWTDRLSAIYI